MSVAVSLWVVLVAAGAGPKLARGDDWVAEVRDIKEDKDDKLWKDYVDNLVGEYEEIPKITPYNDEDDPKYLKDMVDWSPMSPQEIPYLAILYVRDWEASAQYKEFFPREPDPNPAHIEPRKACGGAVITPSRLLTVCGCLAFGIAREIIGKHKYLFGPYDPTPRYDIKSILTGDPTRRPRVYVNFGKLRFEADEDHEVDWDERVWPTEDRLNCGQMILNEAYSTDPHVKATRADAEIIVVPFTPESERLHIYPLWPPGIPITSGTDPHYQAIVRIGSIGMRLREKTKVKFYSSTAVSSLSMVHCAFPKKNCEEHVFPIPSYRPPYMTKDINVTCFCPITKEETPQLSGGVIGWPVVDEKGLLVGLTASDRHPADGSVLVVSITYIKQRELENHFGKEHLHNLNLPPEVYREKDLKTKWLVYDYWAGLARKAQPESRATKLDSTILYLLLALLAMHSSHY